MNLPDFTKPKTEKLTVNFHFKLRPSEKKALQELAKKHKLPMNEIVRIVIMWAYNLK